MPQGQAPLRIGMLGASEFAVTTMLTPAKSNSDVEVVAVGSRDMPSAEQFAERHGIPRAHGTLEALVSDPEIDAVYVTLPTGLHGRWTRNALAEGKHVLCEKPFTANAEEAREIAALAAASDRVVMETVQFRYHPLTLRVEEIIASGELGSLELVDIVLCVMIRGGNCYNYDLAGGATMDAGSYVVNMLRTFGGSTPEVLAATATLRGPKVDRAMTAELRYPEGHAGRLRCALWSKDLFRARAKVVGTRGELRWLSPAAPNLFPRLSIRSERGRRVERFPKRATYAYQLDAFAGAVLRGEPVRTTSAGAVENMTVIDEIYRAAGLPIRQPVSAL